MFPTMGQWFTKLCDLDPWRVEIGMIESSEDPMVSKLDAIIASMSILEESSSALIGTFSLRPNDNFLFFWFSTLNFATSIPLFCALATTFTDNLSS